MNTCINKKRKAENAIVKKERKREIQTDREKMQLFMHT